MSENAPKILIVVLVVIVVVFFVGVGVGAGGGMGSLSVDSAINTLAGLFPSPAVGMDEIDASPSGCFDRGAQRIVIPGGGECALRVAESSANVRSLKLEIVSGVAHLEMTVAPVEGKEMTVSADLPNNGDSQINLTFFPSGGDMLIDECAAGSGASCIINIVN